MHRCSAARTRRTDGWEVDVQVVLPTGEAIRERKKSPVSSNTGSREWGERRAVALARLGVKTKAKEVPTLREFGPRYIEEYARANRQKPSTVIQKERMLSYHLYPRFGAQRLDQAGDADVQKVKATLSHGNPKTENNVLVVLSTLLKAAVKWKVIDRLPCTIELLRVTNGTVEFYEPSEFERLVGAARQIDPRIELVMLLGGDAGLRCGEIIALDQTDLDFVRGLIHVRRSEWEGHLTVPKGGPERTVNMTERLKQALARSRHLRGDRVLWRDDGHEKVTQVLLAKWMSRAQKRAGLKVTGGLPHPPPHLLLAAGDGGGSGEGHPGVGRAPEPHHDSAVHAPLAGREVRGHRAAQPRGGWRHDGDGPGVREEPLSRQALKVSGRQDLNLRPLGPERQGRPTRPFHPAARSHNPLIPLHLRRPKNRTESLTVRWNRRRGLRADCGTRPAVRTRRTASGLRDVPGTTILRPSSNSSRSPRPAG